MVVACDPRPSPVRTAAAAAHARLVTGGVVIDGFGAAPEPEQARLVAVMECAERWAQFGRSDAPAVHDSYAALAGPAVCPLDFGLYAPFQYRQPDFGLAGFDERALLEWVQVTDVATGERRLVPVEFVYPRAPLSRAPLVAETSSGSAAHTDPGRATVAALCEVVERDAAMVLWYRRPLSPVLPVRSLPDPVAGDLAGVSRAGFVVSAARIDHDVAVPTFLVIALRGRSFGYGLGTHPDPAVALEHAVTELGYGIRTGDRYAHLPLGQVRRPEHHRALYDGGPLHDAVRSFLAATLARDPVQVAWPVPDPADPLGAVLGALSARGLAAYSYDLTPAELADCGLHVVRVLVPGLVPVSFGYDRLRLGCRRLTGDTAPGRLSTLLPHFFG
jgi:ribosomal protein S12 methylthiotransferase accessory factor